MSASVIHLIPLPIHENNHDYITDTIKETIRSTTYFAVENVRTSRRFISSLKLGLNIETLNFFVLDKKTPESEILVFLNQLPNVPLCVMSESGCPGIADPGQLLVRIAHKQNIEVKPYIGPSSILLAMMSSGLNGQNFAFIGYLPAKPEDRVKKLKQLEKHIRETHQTQIFIETPYRNQHLYRDILKTLSPEILLNVSYGLNSNVEKISTKTVGDWKKEDMNLEKHPCIFLIGM